MWLQCLPLCVGVCESVCCAKCSLFGQCCVVFLCVYVLLPFSLHTLFSLLPPPPSPLGQSMPVQSPMTVGSSAATVLVGASGGTGYHIVAVSGPSCCRGRRSSLNRAPRCNRKWSPTAHSTWTGLRRLDHLAAAWIGRTLAVY